MKIYTRQGDDGSTGLFDGRRVPKDDVRIEACGTVDELNSQLGLALVDCPPELRTCLEPVQIELFELGADLATPVDSSNAGKIKRVTPERAAALEAAIDRLQAELTPLKRFVLPGGSELAARLHIARTVCRRAERRVVQLASSETITPGVLIYLNRLSDLLFVCARWANRHAGRPDIEWYPEPS